MLDYYHQLVPDDEMGNPVTIPLAGMLNQICSHTITSLCNHGYNPEYVMICHIFLYLTIQQLHCQIPEAKKFVQHCSEIVDCSVCSDQRLS